MNARIPLITDALACIDRYTTEVITDIKWWTPSLVSFKTTRDQNYCFSPGQFARLGTAVGERIVWRAYSIVAPSYTDQLEFYAEIIPNGIFTSQLANLKIGSAIFIERNSYGTLTTDRFDDGRDLWMMGAGTGIAPFISILSDFLTWHDYENLILVHSVRYRDEFVYLDLIHQFMHHELFQQFDINFRYIQTIADEKLAGILHGRIPGLLADGKLESTAKLQINSHSRVMICGDPLMVSASRILLMRRGLASCGRMMSGNNASESYW